MGYRLLADLIVAVHAAYVAFVLFGLLAILLGVVFRWAWVRNWWFRVLHLLAILIVAGEALLNIACPLTAWEQRLRALGGDSSRGGTFIGNLLHDLIFYEASDWAFTTAYVAFALVVALTFWLAPPERSLRSRQTGLS
jgi:Protein of Unknown function (DUF2784)